MLCEKPVTYRNHMVIGVLLKLFTCLLVYIYPPWLVENQLFNNRQRISSWKGALQGWLLVSNFVSSSLHFFFYENGNCEISGIRHHLARVWSVGDIERGCRYYFNLGFLQRPLVYSFVVGWQVVDLPILHCQSRAQVCVRATKSIHTHNVRHIWPGQTRCLFLCNSVCAAAAAAQTLNREIISCDLCMYTLTYTHERNTEDSIFQYLFFCECRTPTRPLWVKTPLANIQLKIALARQLLHEGKSKRNTLQATTTKATPLVALRTPLSTAQNFYECA